MTEIKTASTVCAICAGTKDVLYALPLVRENGAWAARPLCRRCRRAFIAEAQALGKTVTVYSLAGSQAEATRRNGHIAALRKVLEPVDPARAPLRITTAKR
jgi:hypothetical protein